MPGPTQPLRQNSSYRISVPRGTGGRIPGETDSAWDPLERAATMRHLQQMSDEMHTLLADRDRADSLARSSQLEAQRTQQISLLQLAMAAEYRDGETGVHIVRMGFLAEQLGLLTGMSAADAYMLRLAAPMHDVGKMGIPDAVLKKPGPLNAEERAIMNQHPEMGATILGLSETPVFQMAATIARRHHEHYDGRGYPDKLGGKDIPLVARIVTVVDFFDALTMDRCYRPAKSDEDVLQMMGSESGRAFDPELVLLFLRNADTMITLRNRINASGQGLEALLNS